jgi:predicted dehydrogenase
VQDIRKALDDPELDAISIAVPNHWHSLMTIWACQAKKHVYVEKPLSHNPWEGRKVVEAVEKYERVVQHGTQRRSEAGWHQRIAAVASGKYGKLRISYGYASKPRTSIGFAQPQDPPKQLDFNLWLGPAPQQPYHRNLVHYNWHWFWDFGCGEIGNQGAHEMDIAVWAITAATGMKSPTSVISMGGRFGYEDQGQTPNTQLTLFDFGETKLFFEDYGLDPGQMITNHFYLEEGVIRCPGNERNFQFYPNGSDRGEPLVQADYTLYPGDNYQNFINCVRSGKPEELNAKIINGHYGVAPCHLGNISYRLGEPAPFSKIPEEISGDEDAVRAFERMKTNLARATRMDLEKAEYRLGRKLTFDPATETFVGDDEANKILKPDYREKFVVPEEV